MNKNALQRN